MGNGGGRRRQRVCNFKPPDLCNLRPPLTPDQGSAAAEGARRATGDAAGPGRGGRLSVGRKREVVRRLLRGEDLESVSRAVGITAARASPWRDWFLAAGQASLKSRAPELLVWCV